MGAYADFQLGSNLYVDFNMIEASTRETLCELEWSTSQIQDFRSLVIQNYGYKLFLDELPSVVQFNQTTFLGDNIPLGYIKDDQVAIFNHLRIKVQVHPSYDEQQYRIVGF